MILTNTGTSLMLDYHRLYAVIIWIKNVTISILWHSYYTIIILPHFHLFVTKNNGEMWKLFISTFLPLPSWLPWLISVSPTCIFLFADLPFCALWSHLLPSSGAHVCARLLPGHLKGLMYNKLQQMLLSLHFTDSRTTERVPLWDWMSGLLVSPKMGEGSRQIPD